MLEQVPLLYKTLQAIGHQPRMHAFANGSRILVLPHGGRVLGLYTPDDNTNCYWTHPDLNTPDTAKAFFSNEGGGWNTGGDRTWLTPEAQIFIADLNHPWDTYCIPPELDPGSYTLDVLDDGLALSQSLTVHQFASGQDADVMIRKRIASANHPLRGDPDLRSVAYAGYTLTTSLTVDESGVEALPLGLWNSIQLPHGGQMLVASHGLAKYFVQFGVIGVEELSVTPGMLRYHMCAEGLHKIGLHAVAVTGRVGYRWAMGDDRDTLVVRNFAIDPSGHYADVPWDDPQGQGYCFQACNVAVNGKECFSELEHHAPAIEPRNSERTSTDTSQVWGFQGPTAQIDRVSQRLLGTA